MWHKHCTASSATCHWNVMTTMFRHLLSVASYCTQGTCCTCLLLHLRHLLPPIAPTAPAAPVSYCTCSTCSVLHLRHLPSTAPGSHVALAAPAEGWRLSWLLLVFCFPISYNFSSSCCWSLLLSAQRQQRKQPTLANNTSESASSTPRAPAARASYCTYGTCCTCLLLHLRHLLHLPPTPPTAPAFYSSRRHKCRRRWRQDKMRQPGKAPAIKHAHRETCEVDRQQGLVLQAL